MHADFELNPDGRVSPSYPHGGRREGAGRKPGYSPERAAKLEGLTDEELDEIGDSTATAVKKARAVARKEEALANQAELKYRIDSKEYLSRTAFREASATLLAELAQALRSLPDTLERRHALPAKVVQEIEQTIDDALSSVSAGLELFVSEEE